jgi:hypothetical protein
MKNIVNNFLTGVAALGAAGCSGGELPSVESVAQHALNGEPAKTYSVTYDEFNGSVLYEPNPWEGPFPDGVACKIDATDHDFPASAVDQNGGYSTRGGASYFSSNPEVCDQLDGVEERIKAGTGYPQVTIETEITDQGEFATQAVVGE